MEARRAERRARVPRFGRGWRRWVGTLLALVTFVCALVFGAVLHLDLPVTRRAAERLAETSLSGLLRGEIRIERLERLDAFGLTARGVEVFDPEGRQVIRVETLDVDVQLFAVVRRIARLYEKLSIVVDRVTLRGCEVTFENTTARDEHGELLLYPSLVDAFEPAAPSVETTSEGRPVRVWLADVRLEDVFASTHMKDIPVLQGSAREARGSVLITEKGVALDVHRLGVTVSGIGGVDASVTGDFHLRAPGALWGDVETRLGELSLNESFRFEGGRLEVKGAAPAIEPSALRSLWADWPLDQTVSLEHTISGVPPRLRMTAQIHAARGDVKAEGFVTIAPEVEADLDVDAEGLDLSALHTDYPATRLDVRSAIELWQGEDRPHFEVNATILPSEALGTRIPAVDFRGTYDERGVLLDATLHERGLPLHVDLVGPPGKPLRFDVELRRTRLEESPRIQALVPIRGIIQGTMNGELDGDRLAAHSSLQGGGVTYAGAQLDAFHLSGTTTLSLDEPEKVEGNWKLEAQGIRAGNLALDTAVAKLQGPLQRPFVEVDAAGRDGTRMRASATTRTDRVELERVRAEVTGRGQPIALGVQRVSFVDEHLRVAGFQLKSEGELEADLDLSPAGGSLRVEGKDLNLSRIADTVGLKPGTLAGRLSARGALEIGDSSSGSLEIVVAQGELFGVTDLALSLNTQLEGKNTSGQLTAAVPELGRLSGTWNVDIGGHPFRSRSYLDATGRAELSFDDTELALVSRLLASSSGFAVSDGTLQGSLRLERATPGTVPQAELTAKTRGLSLEIGDAPQHIDGVELELVASSRPAERRVELALRANDYLGDVVSLGGSLELPLDAWGEELPPLEEARRIAETAPLELVLSIPGRRLDDFPLLSEAPLAGVLSGRGSVRGSLRDPSLQLGLSVQKLSGAATGLAAPLEVETTLRYRLVTGRLQGDVRAKRDVHRIGSANFDLTVPLEHLTAAPAPDVPLWTGSAQLVLDGAPLDLVSALNERELSGSVQGSIGIERSAYVPHLTADLRLRHLSAQGRSLGEGRLTAENDGDRLLAKAQFDDEYGNLTASAELGLALTSAFVTVGTERPIYLTLRSDKYDAAVLSPFLSDVVSEFSGSMNGTLRAELRPPEEPLDGWKTRFSGSLRMTEGVLTPANMGLRLEDTSFDLSAGPEGALNVVRIENLKARARSERHNLTGSATLYFQDLELVRGRFALRPELVPLLSSGVKLADLTGEASGELESKGGEMFVTLNIPRLHVELPSGSDRELIELSDNPTIEILQPLQKPEQQPSQVEEDATAWNVDVRLGDEVRVKNRIVNLELRGNPSLRYKDELSLTGTVELAPGGRIQVLGRIFVIDHGQVAFDTDAVANPHLDVTATWRAPSGVLVIATVGGTAEKPLLEWSSDPPQPGGEAAVIAMVLGGSGNDRSGGAGSTGVAYSAVIVNQILGEAGVRGVEFYASRQTTSGEGQVAQLSQKTWDNYTAAFQVTDELWFEGSYKQEASGPGAVARSGVSGTIDWRFHPEWSARTEIGTLGVGADLLWQYRY